MATENSATASLESAMSRLVLDTDLVDLTVTCGDMEWKVHSTILAVRSPFFKAAISNNVAEKLEMKIDVEEFDPQAMDDVINFMYGKLIEKGSIKFLLEAAERFEMDDLKEDVVRLAKKNITVENVIEIGHLAENYYIEHLVGECARFIVKNNVHMKEQDVSPKLTVMILNIYQEKSMAGNQKQEKSEEVNSSNYSIDTSLASLISKLVKDYDLRDLIVTCGDYKWKVHSIILAVRSPFFMAAITNNMAEKLDMKIDIKDFDPEVMEEVIDFMYGTPIAKSSVKFLFEAAERFQMYDLKEDVAKFAKKWISFENVVELGHLGEMYNIEGFLRDCAEFIVKNDVQMNEDDVSPKLTVLVLSILKNANLRLKDANMGLLEQLQECECKQYKRPLSRLASLRISHLIGMSHSEEDETTSRKERNKKKKKQTIETASHTPQYPSSLPMCTPKYITVRGRNNVPGTLNYPPNSFDSKNSSHLPPNSWDRSNQDFVITKPLDFSIKSCMNNLSVIAMDNSTPAEDDDTSSPNSSPHLTAFKPGDLSNRDGSTRARPAQTQSSQPLVQDGRYYHPLNNPMRPPVPQRSRVEEHTLPPSLPPLIPEPRIDVVLPSKAPAESLRSLPPAPQWSRVKEHALPPSLHPPALKTRI